MSEGRFEVATTEAPDASGAEVFPLVFEGSRWSGRNGRSVHFDFAAGGGGVFIRSSVPRIALELRAKLAANFALSIASSMGGLEQARGGDYSRIWRSDAVGR